MKDILSSIDWVNGYKTYGAGIGVILGTIGAIMSGTMTMEAGVPLIALTILHMLQRNGSKTDSAKVVTAVNAKVESTATETRLLAPNRTSVEDSVFPDGYPPKISKVVDPPR